MSNLIVDGTVKAPFESLLALFEQETAVSYTHLTLPTTPYV